MPWHEGEGKAARIRVPPAVAYTKGRYTLGAVGQENAAVTTLDLTAQSGSLGCRLGCCLPVADVQHRPTRQRRPSAERCPPGTSAPATFEKVDETFTRLRRARELIIRTGVSVAHRPKARLARGATPANCLGCNPRELSRAATRRELTAEALRRELRAQALGLKCGALS